MLHDGRPGAMVLPPRFDVAVLTNAVQFEDVERNAADSNPSLTSVVCDSSDAASPRNDSIIDMSAVDVALLTETPAPHRHYIIPPSISGHQRPLVARRTVPYTVGVLLVVGAFSWAVCCALFVSPLVPLLGGVSRRTDL
jgi:hypothetical protein